MGIPQLDGAPINAQSHLHKITQLMDISNNLFRNAEAALGRLFSPRLNLAAQAAQAAFFLYAALMGTGLIMFYEYPAEFPAAYETLDGLSKSVSIGGVSRSVHRGAADLMALFAILHMGRVFFLKRFTKGRWGAWTFGVTLLLFIAWQGLSGYTLPMDERAQAILGAVSPALEKFFGAEAGRAFLVNNEITPRTMILLLAGHLVPPIVALALFTGHLRGLKMPRLWPSRSLMAAIAAGLLIAALSYPAQSAAKADFFSAAGPVPFDRLLMWPIHPGAGLGAWGAAGMLLATLLCVPMFIREKKEIVRLYADKCVGCGLCAADCPYRAIAMEPLPSADRHPWVAVIDEARCVGCAVCVGSCGFAALDMPSRPVADIRGEAGDYLKAGGGRIIYQCQNAQNYVANDSGSVQIVKLICAGQLHPRWIEDDVKNGAEMVSVASCDPSSCESRLGGTFALLRFDHLRKPYLRKKVDRSRVLFVTRDGSGSAKATQILRYAGVLILFVSLAIVPGVLWQNHQAQLADSSLARIAVSMDVWGEASLAVTADGAAIFDKTWRAATPGGKLAVFEEIKMPPEVKAVTAIYRQSGMERTFTIAGLQAGETAVVRPNPATAEMELARRR
ncbi:MAG: cytochrome b N-terminal domain-containing protein [Nitrospinae bacterium]|nr:cytochrome b N-terminal domain-containing protein [Nitrospinota bacterium]